MQRGGRLLAEVDALLSMADVAVGEGWVRPTLAQPEDGEAPVLR